MIFNEKKKIDQLPWPWINKWLICRKEQKEKLPQYLVGEFAGKLSSLLEQLLVFLWAVGVEDWYEILKKMKSETKKGQLGILCYFTFRIRQIIQCEKRFQTTSQSAGNAIAWETWDVSNLDEDNVIMQQNPRGDLVINTIKPNSW